MANLAHGVAVRAATSGQARRMAPRWAASAAVLAPVVVVALLFLLANARPSDLRPTVVPARGYFQPTSHMMYATRGVSCSISGTPSFPDILA